MIVTVFGQRAIRVSGGREIELQENAGWVEWRYVGTVEWEQLYEISTGGSGGDVYQAGTQYNNQVAVWTNDSTIEGTNDFMFDGLNLTVTGTTTGENFILSSDRRLKTNIKPIDSTQWVDEIEFVSFFMKSDSLQEKLRYGVIAQDVEKINPYLINKDNKGMLSVSYIDLLIAKAARQDEIIRGLVNRIEKLEK